MPAKGESRVFTSGPPSVPRQQPNSEFRVRLTVNGEAREVPGGATVAALVALLRLDRRKLAVERNLAIVPRSAYAATRLFDGDRIEIVAFVGGG